MQRYYAVVAFLYQGQSILETTLSLHRERNAMHACQCVGMLVPSTLFLALYHLRLQYLGASGQMLNEAATESRLWPLPSIVLSLFLSTVYYQAPSSTTPTRRRRPKTSSCSSCPHPTAPCSMKLLRAVTPIPALDLSLMWND